MTGRPAPLAERFWSKVDKSVDCWLWTGAVAWNGYGIVRGADGRSHIASRLAWKITHGVELDRKTLVCHHCDTRLCVRPDHLFLGSHKDNMVDCAKKGRNARYHSHRTHCKWGHEFTPENTYVYPTHGGKGKGRACKQCVRARTRARRATSKTTVLPFVASDGEKLSTWLSAERARAAAPPLRLEKNG